MRDWAQPVTKTGQKLSVDNLAGRALTALQFAPTRGKFLHH